MEGRMQEQMPDARKRGALASYPLEFLNAQAKRPAETELQELMEWVNRNKEIILWPDLVKTMRDLDKEGYGRFIVGRKGHASRFQWSDKSRQDSSRIVEQDDHAAISEADTLDSASHRVAHDESSTNGVQETLLAHSFHLRPDQTVKFSLPKDLTQAEAERFAAFIRTLPFD